MSLRVVLRADVPSDIHEIIAYLEPYSLEAADRFRSTVFPTMQELARMPGKGSPKHFRHKELRNIRSWWVPGFRRILILYRPMDDGIEVLAVAHGARHLRKLLLARRQNPP